MYFPQKGDIVKGRNVGLDDVVGSEDIVGTPVGSWDDVGRGDIVGEGVAKMKGGSVYRHDGGLGGGM